MQIPRRAVLGAAMLAAPAFAPDHPHLAGAADALRHRRLGRRGVRHPGPHLENRLRERLGEPLVLDPRPGAGGMVGAEVVARSPGGQINSTSTTSPRTASAPSLYKRLAFDPLKDLPGVARLASMPNVLIVKGDSPHRTVQELVRLLRANPEKAVLLLGRHRHLLVSLGRAVRAADRRRDHACALSRHRPQHGRGAERGGAIRHRQRAGLAPAGAGRDAAGAGGQHGGARDHHAGAADPQEAGVKEFDVASWYGIVAPAATPRPIIERIGAELVAALNDPGLAQRYRDFGAEPKPLGPAEYDAYMRAEAAKWAPIVRASGASVD